MVLFLQPVRVGLLHVAVVRYDFLCTIPPQCSRFLQISVSSDQLSSCPPEDAPADRDVRPADPVSRHVQHRDATLRFSRKAPSSLLFFDRQDLTDSGCRLQFDSHFLPEVFVQALRRPLQSFDGSGHQRKVIHEGDDADHVRDLLPAPCGSLCVQVADRVGHREIEQPGVDVPADDQMPVRRDPSQIFQQDDRGLRFRDLLLQDVHAYLILQRRVCVDDVRLLDVPDADRLLQKVSVRLILQQCLTASRNAGVLRRQKPRVDQRFDHQLFDVSDQLMQDGQQCDVPRLPCHAVRTLADRRRLHVVRFDPVFDQIFHDAVQHQPDRMDRFFLHTSGSGQIVDQDFRPSDSGVLLDEYQNVAALPFAFETFFDCFFA